RCNQRAILPYPPEIGRCILEGDSLGGIWLGERPGAALAPPARSDQPEWMPGDLKVAGWRGVRRGGAGIRRQRCKIVETGAMGRDRRENGSEIRRG
ncbi:MAG: hypothetical protein NT154_07495, partial [Verrucomicrobia bacterium]|nr:hypothetical protein [Verrucomicrobiota bacterium]